jgi:hypothetical protein
MEVVFSGSGALCRLQSAAGSPSADTPAGLEYGLVARAQLTDIAGYSGPYRVARALGMDG